jgi:hypothetical protein
MPCLPLPGLLPVRIHASHYHHRRHLPNTSLRASSFALSRIGVHSLTTGTRSIRNRPRREEMETNREQAQRRFVSQSDHMPSWVSLPFPRICMTRTISLAPPDRIGQPLMYSEVERSKARYDGMRSSPESSHRESSSRRYAASGGVRTSFGRYASLYTSNFRGSSGVITKASPSNRSLM